MDCRCGTRLPEFMSLHGAGLLREETVCPACGRFWSAYRAMAQPPAASSHLTVLTASGLERKAESKGR